MGEINMETGEVVALPILPNMSPTIGKLAESLAKAQKVMEGSVKDAKNPFFKSSYSTLTSVWEACRVPLADNGLSVVQTMKFLPDNPDTICVETLLLHSSGEWIRGELAVKPVKSDPQSAGSCITYLRRYSLQSMVGIAPDDDDGNAASGTIMKQPTPPEPPPLPQRAADKTKGTPTDGGTEGAIRIALKTLQELTGGFEADLLQHNSKFTDKDGKEHYVTTVEDLMKKSEKWAKSTLGRLMADIETEKKEQAEKNNGEDIPNNFNEDDARKDR